MANLFITSEKTVIGNLILEEINEDTFNDAENWLCLSPGEYDIYSGSSSQVIEAAQQRSEETGETISEVIIEWATSYGEYEATKAMKQLNTL